jgi:hypothetical protein
MLKNIQSEHTDAQMTNLIALALNAHKRNASIAQARCFDSKIMAQPSVFTENSFKFSGQNTMRARYEGPFLLASNWKTSV